MRVDGASGDLASAVNGVFALEEDLYNGRALYRKVGDPHCWLRFTKNSRWVISNTVDKDANNNAAYAFSSSIGLSLPTDSSVWKVVVNGKWVEQAAMRVKPAFERGNKQRVVVVLAPMPCKYDLNATCHPCTLIYCS